MNVCKSLEATQLQGSTGVLVSSVSQANLDKKPLDDPTCSSHISASIFSQLAICCCRTF